MDVADIAVEEYNTSRASVNKVNDIAVEEYNTSRASVNKVNDIAVEEYNTSRASVNKVNDIAVEEINSITGNRIIDMTIMSFVMSCLAHARSVLQGPFSSNFLVILAKIPKFGPNRIFPEKLGSVTSLSVMLSRKV